jgi:hypothetical protein
MLLAFHKPHGVLSQFTPEPGSGFRTFANFGFPPRVLPIGRLDADSEGLFLLSNEPEFRSRSRSSARSAGFQACCIAGFQTRGGWNLLCASGARQHADLEVGDTAGLETGATLFGQANFGFRDEPAWNECLLHPHRARASRPCEPAAPSPPPTRR